MNAKNNNIIVKNKNASRNYHLSDKFQAGLVLEGWEVKGLRNGKVDVKDSVSYTHLTLPTILRV